MDTKKGLYNIKDTLVTNNEQKFCPVQLEIASKKLLNIEQDTVNEAD